MADKLLSEVINTLAKQSGVDVASDEFKMFLSDPKLVDLNIDSDVVEKINSSLMTFESAKNNHDLQKYFVGQVLAGIDNATKRALKNAGVGDEVMSVFDKEETTQKKVESVIGKLKEVYDKPHQDPDTEKLRKEKEELTSQINELTEKVNLHPEEMEKLQFKLKSEHENQLVGYELTNKLSGYNFNSTLSREDIDTLVRNKIGGMPYVIRKDKGELKVFQKENPDLLAQKDNKTLSVTDLLDDVVSPYIDKGNGDPPPEKKRVEPTPLLRGANSRLAQEMEKSASGGIKPAME